MTRELAWVEDEDVLSVLSGTYDCSLFASGYETRARALALSLRKEALGSVILLGFEEGREERERCHNDQLLTKHLEVDLTLASTTEPGQLAQMVQQASKHLTDEVRVLVDISSMPRSWYSDILNWARFCSGPKSIEIDFVYVGGRYPAEYPARRIARTVSLFGYEGRSDPRLETVAMLGLGYDAVTPLAVLEDLQPELKYGFVAGSEDESALARAVHKNVATIEQLDGPLAVVPLGSASTAYRLLGEMVSPHVGIRNVVFVCLGPKTHVLASLLVAAKNEDVTCLHVQGGPATPINVEPSNAVTVCRVRFETVDGRSAFAREDTAVVQVTAE
jgi:dihydroxyacetone kinase DhaKLM complex PTS-EIIA-like component DhaM